MPLELDNPLTLEIRKSAADQFKRATIAHQSATGLVRLVYADGEEEWVDLAQFEHRWVQPPALPAP